MQFTSKALLTGLAFAAGAYGQAGSCNGLSLGPGANLNGFVPFPANSAWNTDIYNSPVDPNSENYIDYIGGEVAFHPDFGAGLYNGSTIGIPYQVEAPTQPFVPVKFTAYGSESDPGPAPIPANARIEGYPKPGDGDRHVLVLESGACWLYEIDNAHYKNGAWSGDSMAIWDMTINEQRPYTWTSADAAGLPIFVGLARHDEVAAGVINHAFRFTVPTTQEAFTAPASHWASSVTDTNAPPMGMRIRLKASFDISGFPADDQVLLTAMQHYGMILADNGSALYMSGTPDNAWNNDDLNLLKTLTVSDFEVVEMSQIYTPQNVPTGSSPVITQFVASPPTVSPGQPVTLTWNTAGSIYTIVTPAVGPVRASSIVVTPSATTAYYLVTTNQYGRTTSKVLVTVE